MGRRRTAVTWPPQAAIDTPTATNPARSPQVTTPSRTRPRHSETPRPPHRQLSCCTVATAAPRGGGRGHSTAGTEGAPEACPRRETSGQPGWSNSKQVRPGDRAGVISEIGHSAAGLISEIGLAGLLAGVISEIGQRGRGWSNIGDRADPAGQESGQEHVQELDLPSEVNPAATCSFGGSSGLESSPRVV